MEFEQFEPGHLDADRVDDAGTPLLLRPIMWMLGVGDADTAEEQQMDEEQQPKKERDTTSSNDARVDACSAGSPRISEIGKDDDNNEENINHKGNQSATHLNTHDAKRILLSPPGVVSASDTDFDDDNSSSEEEAESSPALDSGVIPSTVAKMADLSLSESNTAATRSSLKRSNRFQHQHDRLGKSSRKMSWSDERGNALATYVSFETSTSSLNYLIYLFVIYCGR